MKEKKNNLTSRSPFPRGRVAFFVSNNAHKFHEMRSVLGEYKIATTLLRVKSPEIQDDDIKRIFSKERKRLMKNRFCEKREMMPFGFRQGATGLIANLKALRGFSDSIKDRQERPCNL